MGTQINKQRESGGSVKQNLTKPRYLNRNRGTENPNSVGDKNSLKTSRNTRN